MSRKSDDSIERIFRQALTQYDTTFKESDWLKMEKMLDEEASRRAAARSKRMKGTGFTLIGLTGLIVAVYFLAFRNPSDPIAKLDHSQTEMQATEDLTDNGNVKREHSSAGRLSGTDSAATEKLSHQNGASDITQQQQNVPGNREDKAHDQNIADDQPTAKEQRRKPMERNELSDESVNIARTFDAKIKQEEIQLAPHNLSDKSAPANNEDRMHQGLPIDADDAARSMTSKNNGDVLERIATQSPAAQADEEPMVQHQRSNKDEQRSDAGETDANKTAMALRDSLPHQMNLNGDVKGSGQAGDKHQGIQTIDTTAQQSAPDEGQILSIPLTKSSAKSDSVTTEKMLPSGNAADSVIESDAMKARKERLKPDSRFSIALVFTPEFSTTSLSQYSTPGESIGLRVGYQLSRRFNINTGIIRSNKKYVGDGSDYTPRNPAYWANRTNGIIPEEIDSKCLVYELPLAVQYDMIQAKKSRLFASTAIVSYVMESQSYDYTFETPNPGADTGWRSAGSESYWFSVAMVSAGYEHYFHRSFAIGIEPYLKISLSEIGWPSVKLFSTGAYVTLRYRFMSKKNISTE